MYRSALTERDMAHDIFVEFNRRLLRCYECIDCQSPLNYSDDYKIVCVECNREYSCMYKIMSIIID